MRVLRQIVRPKFIRAMAHLHNFPFGRNWEVDRNLTILIVEDDQDDVTLLRMALSREHINNPIQTVADGEEAIDYLRGNGKFQDRSKFPFPSIIFTDLKMPRT